MGMLAAIRERTRGASFSALVERYAGGKAMAIVGFETDQVLADGTSVPISAAYNHHFTATLAGERAPFERIEPSGASSRIIHSGAAER